MSAIRNLFNKMRPSFEEGGKLQYSRFHRLEAYYKYGDHRPDASHAVWYV